MNPPSSGTASTPAKPPQSVVHDSPSGTRSLKSLLSAAVFWGVVAGIGEGFGLLLFQRINWAQWARMMHVSKEILWISPAVDLCFYVCLALGIEIVGRLWRSLQSDRVLVFLLVFLTAYDWLMLTGHFYRRAALLFALGVAVASDRWFRKHSAGTLVFFRRSASWLLIVFAFLVIGIQGGKRIAEARAVFNLPAAPGDAPNILVIVVDTLRADHLSCYGYSRPTSPNLDRLAQHGVLFENAIAPSSWSLPSHASLVTGRLVHEHGLGNVEPMPWFGWRNKSLNGLPTLGEALQKRGYRTAAFSANRLYFTSNVGLGRGFIHFEDYFDGVGDSFIRTQFGREFGRLYMNRSEKSKFTRLFRRLGLSSSLDKDSEGSGDYGGVFGIRKRADEVNRETLRWIARDRKHPFLAFLNYLDVHYGYGGPRGYPRPEWDHGSAIDEYDAGIKYTDDFIGRLLHGLDEIGLLKNTVVIVTSDHGESLGDHGLSFHGAALYWELLHVPLIVSWPGHVPEGIRVAQPVSNSAIANTAMEIAGENENPFPGPSLSPWWRDSLRVPPPVVSELPQTNTIVPADRKMQGKIPIATDGWMKSLVSPDWHVIIHQREGTQIYNWRDDPAESKNLAETPEGRAAILSLEPLFAH